MQPGVPASAWEPYRPRGGDRVRPAVWWFVLAGAIALVGVAVAVAIFVRGIADYVDRVDGFDRARLPATLQVEITETGGYSIYHEYDGTFADEPDVSVTDPSGDPVALDRYVGSVSYSTGSHDGEGLFTFHAESTGTYEVTASGDPGSVIAVGRGIGRGLVGTVVATLLVGFVAVVAGAVLAVVVGVKRSRSRRALMPPPPAGGWGPPFPPAGGWGPPPPPPPPASLGWGGPAGPGVPPGPEGAASSGDGPADRPSG